MVKRHIAAVFPCDIQTKQVNLNIVDKMLMTREIKKQFTGTEQIGHKCTTFVHPLHDMNKKKIKKILLPNFPELDCKFDVMRDKTYTLFPYDDQFCLSNVQLGDSHCRLKFTNCLTDEFQTFFKKVRKLYLVDDNNKLTEQTIGIHRFRSGFNDRVAFITIEKFTPGTINKLYICIDGHRCNEMHVDPDVDEIKLYFNFENDNGVPYIDFNLHDLTIYFELDDDAETTYDVYAHELIS